MTSRLLSIIFCLFLLSSCSFLQGDDVVAKVGTNRLYRSELEQYIPAGCTPEDSVSFAKQYINSWALDFIFEKAASENLSKEEKDISEELKTYKNTLIKYRYEQAYLNAKLSTEVTDDEVREYYNSHKDVLTLERPILKVRYLDILADAPQKNYLLDMMSSSDYEEFSKMDSLAHQYAIRYFDSSDQWMDSMVLAREFGTDYNTMLSNKSGDWIKIVSPERVDERIAYVVDISWRGTAPLEYCQDEIRDNILIGRKRDLISGLEQDLLMDALSKKQLIIY